MQNSMDITEDFSKCLIKEAEKPKPENCMVPMTRAPLQVPQRAQGEYGVLWQFFCSKQNCSYLFMLFQLVNSIHLFDIEDDLNILYG